MQLKWQNYPIIWKIDIGVFSGQETPEETSVRETFKSFLKLCLLPHQLPTDQAIRSTGFALALYKISAEDRDFVNPVC